MPKPAPHSAAPFILAEAMNDYEGHKIICARGVIAVTVTEHATKISPEETANAWLFMAAPKLLEALETMHWLYAPQATVDQSVNGEVNLTRGGQAIEEARAAIALARTGKP